MFLTITRAPSATAIPTTEYTADFFATVIRLSSPEEVTYIIPLITNAIIARTPTMDNRKFKILFSGVISANENKKFANDACYGCGAETKFWDKN